MAVIEAIATTYLEADAASVTFTSIPQTYEHLQLRYSGREDAAGAEGALGMQFNGVGSGYTFHRMQGSDSTASAATSTSQTASWLWWCSTASYDAANYAGNVVDILDYRNGSKNTTIQSTSALAASLGDPYVAFVSGLWDDVAAVTSITLVTGFGSNIVRGSEFTLYGLNSS